MKVGVLWDTRIPKGVKVLANALLEALKNEPYII
jgi:hypothetical protein